MFTRLSMWCWMWCQTLHQAVNIVHWSLDEVKRHQRLLTGHLGWWGWTLHCGHQLAVLCITAAWRASDELPDLVSGVRASAGWCWFTKITSKALQLFYLYVFWPAQWLLTSNISNVFWPANEYWRKNVSKLIWPFYVQNDLSFKVSWPTNEIWRKNVSKYNTALNMWNFVLNTVWCHK